MWPALELSKKSLYQKKKKRQRKLNNPVRLILLLPAFTFAVFEAKKGLWTQVECHWNWLECEKRMLNYYI